MSLHLAIYHLFKDKQLKLIKLYQLPKVSQLRSSSITIGLGLSNFKAKFLTFYHIAAEINSWLKHVNCGKSEISAIKYFLIHLLNPAVTHGLFIIWIKAFSLIINYKA